MVAMKDIEAVSREIVDRFHPRRIILFGSHANGTPTEDSDVDLLVVLPFRGRAAFKEAEIRLALDVPFGVDVLARTPEMVRRRLAMGDMFMEDILHEGIVLYDADNR